MCKKTIFLHIGSHKTATTTIQFNVNNQRDRLLTYGYLYPESCVVGEGGHHNIAWQLRDARRYSPAYSTIEDLLTEIENTVASKIIISSEELLRITHAQTQHLARYLEPYNVKIIVYLRRQDLFLQSQWVQLLKMGWKLPDFETWIADKMYPWPHLLDYKVSLGEWAQIFGPEHIVVRPFESSQLDSDIVTDFLRICGVDCSYQQQPTQSVNITPGYKTIAFVQLLTASLPDLAGKLRSEIYVPQVVVTILAHAKENGWNNNNVNVLTEELHEQIMQPYRESNRQVAQTYLSQDELFIETYQAEAGPLSGVETISIEELFAVFGKVLYPLMDMDAVFQFKQANSELRQRNQQLEQESLALTLKNQELNSHNQQIETQLDRMQSTKGWKFLVWYWRLKQRLIGQQDTTQG